MAKENRFLGKQIGSYRITGEIASGAEPFWVRSAIEFIIGRGGSAVRGDEIALTLRAKKVIELALDEAHHLNRQYIGTEHLLLGLVREGEGIAAGILESLGATLEKVRTQIMQVLSQPLKWVRRDLTAEARAGTLDLVTGRHLEIERVIQILSRLNKNNPLLIGKSSVDKTAVVEGLALRMVAGDVPGSLVGKRLLALDVGSLMAETRYHDEFEEHMKMMIEELCNSRDCIIFIDEVHTLVTAGAAENAANLLKPALGRGEWQWIGATTLDEYRTCIEHSAALQCRIQEVFVHESTVEETIDTLKGHRKRYEQQRHLIITDEALRAAATLANSRGFRCPCQPRRRRSRPPKPGSL